MSGVAAGRVAARLQRLGVTIPIAAAPKANYVPYVCSGTQLHVSGQLPKSNEGEYITGQLGVSLTVAEGQEAARACAIQVVSQLQAALGDLDRVKRVVKLNVFVNSTPTFTHQSCVANGASDFIISVFGEEVGRHARCAVGVAQLPFGAAVEVDACVEVAN
ncbi:endoribonuclease L-PSP (pb5) [Trypanosoma rangeli]|uniref:Endoribonuclease L-PSP (Pb5) n=1 Tax=Trypanosoma rangeli TaxID=5698 RepID=A0A3R7NPU0_TRYRA|nr:endoribonuclease L-PSP (pb5) [Trypanosoma rangeli]RNF09664.1 endoribonuclease L-PSP (pb5) [Trypanosoma rangeli]|eukprot:RNF09664.1 endoribonuclease L-PSP (pb5) [Trypanosoma rangeli]